MASAPPEPGEGCNPTAGNWGEGQRAGAGGPVSQGEGISAPSSRSTSKTKGIRLCSDLPLRLRAARRSACSQRRHPAGCRPWLQTLGEVALPARTLAQLARSSGEGEIQRVITTDAVGAFAELPLPADALLVWYPAGIPGTLEPLIAALPPQTLWSHLTALDPAGVDRVLALAQRLGRPASWWLPRIWRCPSRRLTGSPGDGGPGSRAVSPCAAGAVQ